MRNFINDYMKLKENFKKDKILLNYLDSAIFSYQKTKFFANKIFIENKKRKTSLDNRYNEINLNYMDLIYYIDTYIRDLKRGVDFAIKISYGNWKYHNKKSTKIEQKEFKTTKFFDNLEKNNFKTNKDIDRYAKYLIDKDMSIKGSFKNAYKTWIKELIKTRTDIEHYIVINPSNLEIKKVIKENKTITEIRIRNLKVKGNEIGVIPKYTEQYLFFLWNAIISSINMNDYYEAKEKN